MIISLFRSTAFLKIIIFAVLSLVLWLGAFINPPSKPQLLLDGFLGYLLPDSFVVPALASTIPAFGFVVVHALFLNNILTSNTIFSKLLFFPALIFVMLSSFDPSLLILHDGLIISLLITLSFQNLFQLYDKRDTLQEAFNAAFWIGVASFIRIEASIMMLFVWGSFLICRITAWREWIISALGYATPWLLTASVLYLTNNFRLIGSYFAAVEIGVALNLSAFYTTQMVFFIFTAFLLLLGMVKIESEIRDKVISIRKSFAVIKLMLFIAVFTFIAGGNNPSGSFYFIAPPASVVLSYFFMVRKKLFWAELLFLILLGLIIAWRFI